MEANTTGGVTLTHIVAHGPCPEARVGWTGEDAEEEWAVIDRCFAMIFADKNLREGLAGLPSKIYVPNGKVCCVVGCLRPRGFDHQEKVKVGKR